MSFFYEIVGAMVRPQTSPNWPFWGSRLCHICRKVTILLILFNMIEKCDLVSKANLFIKMSAKWCPLGGSLGLSTIPRVRLAMPGQPRKAPGAPPGALGGYQGVPGCSLGAYTTYTLVGPKTAFSMSSKSNGKINKILRLIKTTCFYNLRQFQNKRFTFTDTILI